MHDVAVPHGLGDPLGHRAAELGQAVARPAAVEDALGVVHLAVSQEVDDRLWLSSVTQEAFRVAAAASAARGQGVEHGLDRAVVVGAGEEPCLVRRRWQVHARVEHGVEEGGVRRGVLRRGRREVVDRLAR